MLRITLVADNNDSLDYSFTTAIEFSKRNNVIVILKFPKVFYDGDIKYRDIVLNSDSNLESLCKQYDMIVMDIYSDKELKDRSEKRIEKRKWKNRKDNLNNLLENEDGI